MTTYSGTVTIAGSLSDSQGDSASFSGTLQDTLVATLNSAGSGSAYETVSGDVIATQTSGGAGTEDIPFDFTTPSFQFQLGNFAESQPISQTVNGVTITVSLTGSVSADGSRISEMLSAPFSGTTEGVSFSGSIDGSALLTAPALSITGTLSGQTTSDTASLSPLRGVTVSDLGANQTESVTVTLSDPANGALSNLDGGTYAAASGVYAVSGSPAMVTAAVDGLVFIPTPHQGPAGETITTGFTIHVTDSGGSSAFDSSASVATTESAPPPVASFDGASRSDLAWRNVNGDAGIWLTTAAGGFSPVDFGVIDSSWTIQAVGDFNGDGKADILWRNSNGQVGEWQSTAGAGYSGFTTPILASVDPSWNIEGVGDFNGDRLSDILWRNTDGDTGIWVTEAGGRYTPVDFGVIDNSWNIQGVGDFNGDGKADILWRNSNGKVGEWLSKAGSGYAFTTQVLATVDPGWQIQGVGDFTGDGLSDILWRNTDGDTGIWITTPGGGFTAVDFGVVGGGWTIQGVGDFNGDGKADILWRDSSGQVGEWLSKPGAGYTGFTYVIVADVDPSWKLQGIPPALQGGLATAAPLAQAMAGMGVKGDGQAASLTMAAPSATQPLIAPATQRRA